MTKNNIKTIYLKPTNCILPDCFMDLSIGEYPLPLYMDILRDFGCPMVTVPAYSFLVGSQVTGERTI